MPLFSEEIVVVDETVNTLATYDPSIYSLLSDDILELSNRGKNDTNSKRKHGEVTLTYAFIGCIKTNKDMEKGVSF